jgi:predicted ABC-type transport system involved in lysophospholipase L1 biosynthesis ATPase subunit
MTFSVVIMLIADLDRASEGTVQLDMQALYDLQQKLHAAAVH